MFSCRIWRYFVRYPQLDQTIRLQIHFYVWESFANLNTVLFLEGEIGAGRTWDKW